MATKETIPTSFEEEVKAHAPHVHPAVAIDRLSIGLKHARKLMLQRIFHDVQQRCATDSMLASTSLEDEQRKVRRTSFEIDIYSTIIACDEIVRGGHVQQTESWVCQQLFQLRLNDKNIPAALERIEYYRSESVGNRRLKFVKLLQQVMPESRKSPLVLFRLFPRAVRIVAAVAFGDPLRAQELRAQQGKLLPAVGDCRVPAQEVCPGPRRCRRTPARPHHRVRW